MPKQQKSKASARKVALTDDERHARFVETAKEVEADESVEAFDHAFERIVSAPIPNA